MSCTAHRTTSQGDAYCGNTEQHNGDHLAHITDPDGQRWVASWSDRWPGSIQLATVKITKRGQA